MGYSNEKQHQAPYKKMIYENKKKFNPRQILQSEDMMSQMWETPNTQRDSNVPARKYQCRN